MKQKGYSNSLPFIKHNICEARDYYKRKSQILRGAKTMNKTNLIKKNYFHI